MDIIYALLCNLKPRFSPSPTFSERVGLRAVTYIRLHCFIHRNLMSESCRTYWSCYSDHVIIVKLESVCLVLLAVVFLHGGATCSVVCIFFCSDIYLTFPLSPHLSPLSSGAKQYRIKNRVMHAHTQDSLETNSDTRKQHIYWVLGGGGPMDTSSMVKCMKSAHGTLRTPRIQERVESRGCKVVSAPAVACPTWYWCCCAWDSGTLSPSESPL